MTQLATEATQLRWVQTLAAGPDGVLAAGFPDSVTITNGRGLHNFTVAETALTLALTGIKQVPEMLAAQREHRWEHGEFGEWRTLRPNGRLGSLIETNVLVWGFGAIGQQIARLFTTLNAHVKGVANSAGERAGFEVVTDADLPTLLPQTDVLVMVLPSAPDTQKALNAERIALLPDHAWVINVGRGVTVDQDALVAALTDGTLGGAALDVTDPEPYPADGPLWDAPNTVIFPHVAGASRTAPTPCSTTTSPAFRRGRRCATWWPADRTTLTPCRGVNALGSSRTGCTPPGCSTRPTSSGSSRSWTVGGCPDTSPSWPTATVAGRASTRPASRSSPDTRPERTSCRSSCGGATRSASRS
ncbi:phosphoglycerate dehydrogenase [Propioniciclava coleopterorum]|uniref:Phosphoglycerate dehydrogenase n=1 Tax=Propioniciclava coleopterorum TaxID=2714937 RepID=A0A6G7Y4C3_9ACTN|nr:phosphoglycerate dehydrogenase [Propioniciclava coleopterorum]